MCKIKFLPCQLVLEIFFSKVIIDEYMNCYICINLLLFIQNHHKITGFAGLSAETHVMKVLSSYYDLNKGC